jgi:hypothetical protein
VYGGFVEFCGAHYSLVSVVRLAPIYLKFRDVGNLVEREDDVIVIDRQVYNQKQVRRLFSSIYIKRE